MENNRGGQYSYKVSYKKGDEFGALIFDDQGKVEQIVGELRGGVRVENANFNFSIGISSLKPDEYYELGTVEKIWDRLAKEADIGERREKNGPKV